MEPKKLGRPTDQRLAVLRNQASELLWYGKIETTVDRAKSVKSIAEKLITLAINTYEDTVKVTKTKTNLKGEKVEVEFTNDGPKKLAARRKMIAELRDIPEAKEEKESKTGKFCRFSLPCRGLGAVQSLLHVYGILYTKYMVTYSFPFCKGFSDAWKKKKALSGFLFSLSDAF